MKIKALVLLSTAIATANSFAIVVTSNNPAPGDFYTESGSTATGIGVNSFSFANNTWNYRAVKGDGFVGINNTFADNHGGSGSVRIGGVGTGSQAQISLLNSAVTTGSGDRESTGIISQLGALTALSYEAFRSSGNDSGPSLSLSLFVPDAGAPGGFAFTSAVFEIQSNAGNGATQLVTGAWTDYDLVANKGGYTMRSTRNAGSFVQNQYYTLDHWMTTAPLAVVVGVNVGIGSGESAFEGATDHIGIGFSGADSVYDFEAVPEPATMTVLGVAALAAWRKHKARK
ncbi:hypothetical protein C0431_06520 [bacterium]|jgi:hypothetical protein|nr:hypothetical protein [bacterium]